jgi:site-specific DNA recombinase
MIESIIKRIIIYIRVSTKEQVDEGNSLATQEKACRDFAYKNGYEVVAIFVEEGESAKTTNRKELLKMIDYCSKHKGEIDAIVFYKIDRLSRDAADYLSLKALFKRLNIVLCSISEKLEDSPSGRFMETVIASTAQFDNEIRSERCKGGMITAVQSGRYAFGAPFGYTNGVVNGDKNIVVDKERAPFVKRMFELLATGLYSQEDVRRIITEEGARLRSGAKIGKQYFHKMVRKKVYKGVIDSFDLGEIKGVFEPIVSNDLFDEVQFILNRRGKRKTGYNVDNPDFPLRGLIMSENGHRLDGSWSKGNAKARFPYYRLRGLNGFNIRKEVLEEKFNNFLKDFEFEKDYLDLLKDSLLINWEHHNQANKQQKSQLEKKICDLKEKQRIIVDKNLKGVFDDDLAKEQLEKVRREIIDLTIKLKGYNDLESIQDVLEYSLYFMQSLAHNINKLEIRQRKNLQWFLFPDGIIFDGQKLRTNRTALILNTKTTSLIEKSLLVVPRGIEPLLPG